MEAHKDITEMSFEEFFSDSGVRSEKRERREKAPAGTKPSGDGMLGFYGKGPKVNYTAGRFQLYVPRFTGRETDQFNVAIDCAAGIIPMGRLESTRSKGGLRTTRPTTLDLNEVEVSPLECFTFTIDGESVFENKSKDVIFFNNIGIPMAKPVGDVFAVHLPSVALRLVKAELTSSETKDGFVVDRLSVSTAGGVWAEASEKASADRPAEKRDKGKPVAKKPAPKKKTPRVTAKMTFSEPSKDAEVICDGNVYPLYTEPFTVTVGVTNADISDLNIRVAGPSGEVLPPSAASAVMRVDTGEAFGPADIILERKDGKAVAKESVFLMPGLQCDCAGKGDIVDDPKVEYTLFGETHAVDLFEEDAYGPFERDGLTYYIKWFVPVITYDIGDGERRFAQTEVSISDISCDYLKVTVKGARKKALFFGKEQGKKVNLTPEWEEDTVKIDMAPIRDEIFGNQSQTYSLFITVNSFPNRKFMTIINPVRLRASYADGIITVDVDPSVSECVCSLFNVDRSQTDVRLNPGTNTVDVDQQVISADVVEYFNGKVRTSLSVPVKRLPFLLRDEMQDYWMYVSRSKRIPLPDGLIEDGKPNMEHVRAWHGRIVRMNPELKGVTLQMIERAFSEIGV